MNVTRRDIRNASDADTYAAELSLKHGGAWVWARDWENETIFVRYAIPSKISCFYLEHGSRCYFKRGQKLSFSKKRIIRFQNQGTANR